VGVQARDVQIEEVSVAAGTETKHAVVVGVSTYAHAGIPSLPCAENDARKLHDVLIDPRRGGFEPGNTRLLLGSEATREAVQTALSTFLTRGSAEGDLVFIFLATHGAIRGKKNKGYLFLHDTDPSTIQSLRQSALRMQDLADLLSEFPAQQVVLVLDACFSGGALEWTHALKELDPEEEGSRVILAAAARAQRALESDRDGHGLFSKHLIRALRGEASRGEVVTALEAFNYVCEKVKAEAAELGYEQQPTFFGHRGSPMVLARRPRPNATPGQLTRHVGPRLLLHDEVGARIRIRLTCWTTIGRSPDCDIQLLGDGTISRDHGHFVERGRHWVYVPPVGNAQAMARTRVNGSPVAPGGVELRHEDQIKIGETTLEFLDELTRPVSPESDVEAVQDLLGAGNNSPAQRGQLGLLSVSGYSIAPRPDVAQAIKPTSDPNADVAQASKPTAGPHDVVFGAAGTLKANTPTAPAGPTPVSPGPRSVQEFSIPPGQSSLSVGRSPACGLVLTDPGVSQRHLTISIRNGVAFVEDLKSNNGTSLNGQRIPPLAKLAIQSGDLLVVGTTTLRYGGRDTQA
jgi:pSer/pThr/pTyr-binding forkhead associated (FHA) protein